MVPVGAYRSSTNLLPSEFSACDTGDNYFALAVEAHDFHAHGAGSATLNLVLVAEEVDTCLATAIV